MTNKVFGWEGEVKPGQWHFRGLVLLFFCKYLILLFFVSNIWYRWLANSTSNIMTTMTWGISCKCWLTIIKIALSSFINSIPNLHLTQKFEKHLSSLKLYINREMNLQVILWATTPYIMLEKEELIYSFSSLVHIHLVDQCLQKSCNFHNLSLKTISN